MTDHVLRFQAALTVLASHGHIKQRLIRAYEENLDGIDEDELPIAIKQAFADFRQSMQRVTPLHGESAVCASVRKMSPEEASEHASQVVAFFAELSRRRNKGSAGLPIDDGETPRVPPFLVKTV